jgi:hypothetical protein
VTTVLMTYGLPGVPAPVVDCEIGVQAVNDGPAGTEAGPYAVPFTKATVAQASPP